MFLPILISWQITFFYHSYLDVHRYAYKLYYGIKPTCCKAFKGKSKTTCHYTQFGTCTAPKQLALHVAELVAEKIASAVKDEIRDFDSGNFLDAAQAIQQFFDDNFSENSGALQKVYDAMARFYRKGFTPPADNYCVRNGWYVCHAGCVVDHCSTGTGLQFGQCICDPGYCWVYTGDITPKSPMGWICSKSGEDPAITQTKPVPSSISRVLGEEDDGSGDGKANKAPSSVRMQQGPWSLLIGTTAVALLSFWQFHM